VSSNPTSRRISPNPDPARVPKNPGRNPRNPKAKNPRPPAVSCPSTRTKRTRRPRIEDYPAITSTNPVNPQRMIKVRNLCQKQ